MRLMRCYRGTCHKSIKSAGPESNIAATLDAQEVAAEKLRAHAGWWCMRTAAAAVEHILKHWRWAGEGPIGSSNEQSLRLCATQTVPT